MLSQLVVYQSYSKYTIYMVQGTVTKVLWENKVYTETDGLNLKNTYYGHFQVHNFILGSSWNRFKCFSA